MVGRTLPKNTVGTVHAIVRILQSRPFAALLMHACSVQIARWHDDPAWLRMVRDHLHYSIEDFEQNLVAYALIIARTGRVPNMKLEQDSGLWFRSGRDMISLRSAGLRDMSVLQLQLPKPANAWEWERFELWGLEGDDLGIREQVQGAEALRSRWQPSRPNVHRTRVARRGNMTARTLPDRSVSSRSAKWLRGPGVTESDQGDRGTGDSELGRQLHSWLPWMPGGSGAPRSEQKIVSFSGTVSTKAYQLVIPTGSYSTFSLGSLKTLLHRSKAAPDALNASVNAVHNEGMLFCPAFPPVRVTGVPRLCCQTVLIGFAMSHPSPARCGAASASALRQQRMSTSTAVCRLALESAVKMEGRLSLRSNRALGSCRSELG